MTTLFFTDSVRRYVDKGYIDFRKTFDMLSHGKLLSKFTAYGIWENNLKWFTDYLFNREQYVVSTIEKGIFNYGCTPGTTVIPAVFQWSWWQLEIHPDCQICWCGGKSLKVIETKLNHDMDEISKWCYDNELILNMKKGKTEASCLEHLNNSRKYQNL